MVLLPENYPGTESAGSVGFGPLQSGSVNFSHGVGSGFGFEFCYFIFEKVTNG
jgi:hypothetical protein